MTTDLNDLLQLVIQDKGGTADQYNNLMNQIAYHETGALQRMNPRATQEGGGPGRGLFMFEEGHEQGGNTAVNRTHKYLKTVGAEVPQWLNDIWEGKKSVDASKLSPEKQRMLFLGNYMQHPQANFSDVVSGGMTTKEFWSNYHWAGKEDNLESRMKSFDASMADIRKKNNNDIAPFVYTPAPMTYTKQKEEFNPNTIWDTIFGQDSSSIVDNVTNKEYDHGGVHLPTAEPDATSVAPEIAPTISKAPVLTQKMYDVIKESQHNQNILSNDIKLNYLQKLLSGYYNMTRYGNNPHFSQDPEVKRSWWDKITDTKYNYKNMGKE